MLVLKNATVFGDSKSPPAQGSTIIVKGNRIDSVGVDVSLPGDADVVIDLRGKFVLPGLIDAHVHFGGTDVFDYPGVSDRHETYDFLQTRAEALKWGITTIRSTGDYTPDIFDFRDEVDSGMHISPRIVAAGKMIQAKGGHPMDTVFGSIEKITAGAAVMVDESTDIEYEVKQLADSGADWIKAFICEVNKMDYPNIVPRIPPATIAQIVEMAHKYGKPCMLHVDNVRHMREAAIAGADSIEHVFAVGATEIEIEDDLIDMLVKKQIYVVPTVYSIQAHENPDGNMPLVYEKLIPQVNKLIRAGVKIGVGTDAVIPFIQIGESLHEELARLVLCGMTPAEAIRAATEGNAKLLRKESEIGSVLPGFFADLLVVDGDPLADINNTKNIFLVISNGRIVTDNTGIKA